MPFRFDDYLRTVKDHLCTEEVQALEFELRDENRKAKLYTEVFIMARLILAGHKISRPYGNSKNTDIILHCQMQDIAIEIYEPDVSKVRSIKEAKKNAKTTLVNGLLVKSWPNSYILDELVTELVHNVIQNKKRKKQFTNNEKNVLIVDLGYELFEEGVAVIDHFHFLRDGPFETQMIQEKLSNWQSLSALIFARWHVCGKQAVVFNKNLSQNALDKLKDALCIVGIV